MNLILLRMFSQFRPQSYDFKSNFICQTIIDVYAVIEFKINLSALHEPQHSVWRDSSIEDAMKYRKIFICFYISLNIAVILK